MAQIKGQAYHYNVEDPPAGFISHKIFQHFIAIADAQECTLQQLLRHVLSTSRASGNLS
jgi:hypothetical protein